MVCDHLEGWDREGWREGDARGKRYGDICICITDSVCYKAESDTPLYCNYTLIKMLKKTKKKTRYTHTKKYILRKKKINGYIYIYKSNDQPP